MQGLKSGSDVLFILLGAILVLAMHAGFAFLELGTVRKKNQVNALVKILSDFCVSTVAYFFVGYGIAYGVTFFTGAEHLAQSNGYELVRFFFLLTFAAAVPAIVSGGIAERARFYPQLVATCAAGGLCLPVLRRHRLEPPLRHAGLAAGAFRRRVPRLRRLGGGACGRRLDRPGRGAAARRAARPLHARRAASPRIRRRSIPFLALGAWILTVGWFGFNVMCAQTHRQDQRPGRDQLADGDGRRHAGRAGGGPQRPGLRAQRPAGRAGRDLRGLGRRCIRVGALVIGAVAGGCSSTCSR